MSIAISKEMLSGWGRWKPVLCSLVRPERRKEFLSLLGDEPLRPLIPRGLGRSYGDAAVNSEGSVLDISRLNRMLHFDKTTGTLECEGGVSLEDILDAFVPRGFFLPVTPGTKYVTVAGAIANDVHGKNHHCDGSFSQFVESFELWTPARGMLTCSRETNHDLFWATVGGVGLTGVIVSARIRLRPIESAYVLVDYRRCTNLDAALEVMAVSDKDYLYSVAWVDCLSSGRSLGRSIVMQGNPAGISDLSSALADAPLKPPSRFPLAVPVDCPNFFLNSWSVKAFNILFYKIHKETQRVLVDYDKYFYPLDRIRQWNRLYGKKGFIQYQAIFPFDQRVGLVKMLEKFAYANRASFLAVLKCFGEQGEGLLSFPRPGYTLALDLPNQSGLEEFVRGLDRLVLDHGGRLYLAKDALMTAETFSTMYPQLEQFRNMCDTYDPHKMLNSNMARRLRLK